MEFYSQNINWILLFAVLNKLKTNIDMDSTVVTIIVFLTLLGGIYLIIKSDNKRIQKREQIKKETIQKEEISRINQPEFLSESEFQYQVLLNLNKMATSQEKTQSNISLITNILVITFICQIIGAIITIIYLS